MSPSPAVAPIHLRPARELAERVLLPGDPQRALAVAQALLREPKMFNHHRGLWGYTGEAPDGLPLTVQSTGMGGPSAAIVVRELIDLGARTLVRIGTCGALAPELALGELVVAVRVLAADGTSAALGAGEHVLPDAELTDALLAASGARPVVAVSTDVFYSDGGAGPERRWQAEGAQVLEMEAAAVIQVASRAGARAACVLAVSDEGLDRPREQRLRLDPEELDAAGLALGEAALAGLGAGAPGEPG